MAAQMGRSIQADGIVIKAVDHDGNKDAWIGPDRQSRSRTTWFNKLLSANPLRRYKG
jgi:hypothetical protein